MACAALAWQNPVLAKAPGMAGAGGPEADAPSLRLAEAPRWADVVARAAAERRARSRIACMMPAEEIPEDCAFAAWHGALMQLRDRPAGERIAGVQRAVNRLRYVSDLENWGMADRWATPAEMFARGGDCEDFALAKYFALRELGFAESALRIAILWDARDGEQHAVLFVEAGGGRWVLDNKFDAPVPAEAVADRYRVIYSVNREGASLSPTAFGGQAGSGRVTLARGGTMLVIRARPARKGRERVPVLPAPAIRYAAIRPAALPIRLAGMGAAIVPAGPARRVAEIARPATLPPALPRRRIVACVEMAAAGRALSGRLSARA